MQGHYLIESANEPTLGLLEEVYLDVILSAETKRVGNAETARKNVAAALKMSIDAEFTEFT